ncbi:hypothetical protein F9B74_00230 [Pelistega sp. NLN82]|uniref:Uncharacterized protein n=1 Tax=Pelistega ratti TaxID=2652177 RepID=A0A6L9Y468_9BURK|nr:hypothetical protein [Pelistega ratti]NEN74757.1 hypothetical protein [Pelistega ratti]
MDRRSFFKFGRTGLLPQTEWDNFCHRIQRTVKGQFRDITCPMQDYGVAEIYLENSSDIQHIFALCQVYHVTMALAGFIDPEGMYTRPILIVHYACTMNKIEWLSDDICLVQPSVTAGDMLALGFQQFTRVPTSLYIAQWFSNPLYHDCRPFHSFLSGVERIQALFSDGSQAVLGGFGVQDQSALSVPILNRCIPKLFELLQDKEVASFLDKTYWPYEYRLDALEKHFVDINLARVFQGQKARLLWVQAWVIRKIPEDVLYLPSDIQLAQVPEKLAPIQFQMKNLFDMDGIFLYDDEVTIMEENI